MTARSRARHRGPRLLVAVAAAAALTAAGCSSAELDTGPDLSQAGTTTTAAGGASDSGEPGATTTDAAGETTETDDPDADHTAERSLTFIALSEGDGPPAGAVGEVIGCDDVAVAVPYTTTTITPLAEVMAAQVAAIDTEYADTGLYNVLAMSDLELVSATIDDGHATIELTGDLITGGICDIPRVHAQLENTALQFDNVDTVTVYVDGETLEDRLSLK